jgi:hypothetical protein
MGSKKEEDYSLLLQLAEKLGVQLDISPAISTPKKLAFAKAHDDKLEVMLSSFQEVVAVEGKKLSGIRIQLIDPTSPSYSLAPAGAMYEISAYMPDSNKRFVGDGGTALNGHVATVYVGKDGIILDEPALRRASDLYQKISKK